MWLPKEYRWTVKSTVEDLFDKEDIYEQDFDYLQSCLVRNGDSTIDIPNVNDYTNEEYFRCWILVQKYRHNKRVEHVDNVYLPFYLYFEYVDKVVPVIVERVS